MSILSPLHYPDLPDLCYCPEFPHWSIHKDCKNIDDFGLFDQHLIWLEIVRLIDHLSSFHVNHQMWIWDFCILKMLCISCPRIQNWKGGKNQISVGIPKKTQKPKNPDNGAATKYSITYLAFLLLKINLIFFWNFFLPSFALKNTWIKSIIRSTGFVHFHADSFPHQNHIFYLIFVWIFFDICWDLTTIMYIWIALLKYLFQFYGFQLKWFLKYILKKKIRFFS